MCRLSARCDASGRGETEQVINTSIGLLGAEWTDGDRGDQRQDDEAFEEERDEVWILY